MKPTNHITTVIPVYNGEKYLERTLDSLAGQRRRPDRIIVLDDCSTDGTKEIVKSYSQVPCELIENEQNVGLFPNMNLSLKFSSKTTYLHLLHADDLILPDFLIESLKSLENELPGSFSFCESEWIDENDRVIPPSGQQRGDYSLISRKHFLIRMSELNVSGCGAMLFKTDFRPLPYCFRNDFPQIADVMFYAELASKAPAIFHSSRVMSQIRRHAQSVTSANVKDINSWVINEWRVIQIILKMIPENRMSSALRKEKLKCLFAARSFVKQRQMKKSNSRYAAEIEIETGRLISYPYRFLGKMAVKFRDIYRRFF